MFKTAALAALVLLDDLKPKPDSRAEKYITDRVPMLELVPDKCPHGVWAGERCFKCEAAAPKKPRVAKPRKPRKRHICEYSRSDLWATFVLGAILGAFALHVLTHI